MRGHGERRVLAKLGRCRLGCRPAGSHPDGARLSRWLCREAMLDIHAPQPGLAHARLAPSETTVPTRRPADQGHCVNRRSEPLLVSHLTALILAFPRAGKSLEGLRQGRAVSPGVSLVILDFLQSLTQCLWGRRRPGLCWCRGDGRGWNHTRNGPAGD